MPASRLAHDRAMLTGALVGAQVELEGIPKRFLDGLENREELLALAKKSGLSLNQTAFTTMAVDAGADSGHNDAIDG